MSISDLRASINDTDNELIASYDQDGFLRMHTIPMQVAQSIAVFMIDRGLVAYPPLEIRDDDDCDYAYDGRDTTNTGIIMECLNEIIRVIPGIPDEVVDRLYGLTGDAADEEEYEFREMMKRRRETVCR